MSQVTHPGKAAESADVARVAGALRTAVTGVIQGKDDVVAAAVTTLLAQGHLLVEDVPGVGKTVLAKAIGKAIDASVRRIQFTPDLMPSDITGVSIYNQDTHDFEFKPGPVFANVVVGDEINRASPKTQSALLECMEEATVTVDAVTYTLAQPFMVVATQNPVEMDGTYPLPEAQRDRFMMRLSMGYPAAEAELGMLAARASLDPLERLAPVTDAKTLAQAQRQVRQVHVAELVQRYIVAIAAATRTHPELRLGASPRAALHLLRASQAWAAAQGRDIVLPDDVQDLAPIVLAHRLVPSAVGARRSTRAVVEDILVQVPQPRGR